MAHAALLVSLSLALGARPVVLLSPEDRSLILGPVIQSLQAQLSDLPVDLRVEPVPKLEGILGAQMRVARQVAGEDGLAVVWLELSPGDPVFVFVADPQRNRVLARSIDWDGALGHLEAVGLIVRSSVQALLAGESIGFEAAPISKTGSPMPAPVARESPYHLGLSIDYTPSKIASDAPVMHAVGLAIDGGYKEHFFAVLEYRLTAPFLHSGTDRCSIAQVWRHSVSLGAGGRITYGRFRFGGDLSGTLQIVRLEAQQVEDCTKFWTLDPPRSNVVFSISPTVSASVTIVRPLSVFIAAGIDIPLGERRFFLSESDTQTVITPWSVQPRGTVGLRFEIF